MRQKAVLLIKIRDSGIPWSSYLYSYSNTVSVKVGDWLQILILKDDAVIAQSQVARLTSPTKGDFEFVKKWMLRTDLGNILFHDRFQDVWQETPDRKDPFKDAIGLNARGFDDALSRLITEYAIQWFHALIGKHSMPVGVVRLHTCQH